MGLKALTITLDMFRQKHVDNNPLQAAPYWKSVFIGLLQISLQSEWNLWGTYREADREMWRFTALVLPPGIAAKRRLRAFKVYVLIHTRRIIICHPAIRHRSYLLLCFCWQMFNNHHCMCSTYTEEEREDVMLGLDLELVIWGYLILEYSLSFILFLCKETTWQEADSV